MLSLLNFIKEKIFSKNHRSLELKKNIFASFGIKALSVFISFLLVPLTINYISPVQYGFWLTISSIVSWLSFLDIGFGNGLRNQLAQSKAMNNLTHARSLVSTTYFVLAVIFSLVFVLFFAINFHLKWDIFLNAPLNMAKELSLLAIIVVTFFCLQMILKTLLIILIADQQPAKAAFIEVLGQLLALIIIFFLVEFSEGSLIKLAFALGFSPVLILMFFTFYYFRGYYNELSPKFNLVRFDYAKDIISLGVKFFIIQIAAIIIYQTNNVVITHIDGPSGVTVYNIAFKYLSIGSIIFSIIINPFWSSFTDAFTIGDYDWMKNALKKIYRLAFFLIIFTLLLLVFSKYAYNFWVGDSVIILFSVSSYISIYIILNIWTTLHSILLNGIGKIKLQLCLSVLAVFFHIPLSIYLGNQLGIEGVVLSSILIHIVGAVVLPIQLKLILNKKSKLIWNS